MNLTSLASFIFLSSPILSAGSIRLSSSKLTPTNITSMRGGASSDRPILVFSDVDGTLVHYPDDLQEEMAEVKCEDEIHNLKLPPSSTGLRGIISSNTIELCQKIRRENAKFVLVSGMRTSTLLKRLPYLPRADAYASESGGRIFYPIVDKPNYDGDLITPKEYNGATEDALTPFGLEEDLEWRSKVSKSAGIDGYTGDVFDVFKLRKFSPSPIIPMKERNGALWQFAKELESKGFIIDYRGYSCSFRVNLKQQVKPNILEGDFSRLTEMDISGFGLSRSVNLGCVDFYPKESGKKNCCAYLASKFLPIESMAGEELLKSRAICICDDDNDIEMALACKKSFLPSVTSLSMMDLVRENPRKIIVSERVDEGIVKTRASEEALKCVLEEIKSSRS